MLDEICAQRVTVLQLAIQSGAGVFGEISACVGSCCVGLRSQQAVFPDLAFLCELRPGSFQRTALTR